MADGKLFTVRLTDEERAALDAYRAANGLRSEAEAIRHLISSGAVARAVRTPDQAAAAQRQARPEVMQDREAWKRNQILRPDEAFKGIGSTVRSALAPYVGDLPRRGASPKKGKPK